MHFYSTLSYLGLFASSATATALEAPPDVVRPPPFFALAGDSTTAPQSVNGGGWGAGFLNTTLHAGATGKNFGHNGATTVSFREGGDWANVLAAAKAATKEYDTYVVCQFGHNDQKPAKNISIEQYSANLARFVQDILDVSAWPILVTPLSRRNFDSAGRIKEDLADMAAATLKVAKQIGAQYIDLNAASTKYLNAIGPDKAHTYNLSPSDNTHLNDGGSIVFGNMVALLMNEGLIQLNTHYVSPIKDIEDKLEKDEYVSAYV
ncbi:carbohydrate esterase family 12 protein [Bipolaris zeicola 26-R-13]|uniref:Carbohydrate esterase family 12 protein n=1 Tax=Cochliobolus carbonum (strain 26-R-13) TaxID=930089 RepID=W6XTH0_COCC2|nr:carbohydrate esterase family 12 protein [Bipolaris zeicola 26-R-13]EUC28923.1 carbohydrate esterase family 12 protein [Bipolaris zeicola 26-R-13]